MVDGLRRLIERVLPWYDPEAEARRAARVAKAVERGTELASQLRKSYKVDDDRVAHRGSR